MQAMPVEHAWNAARPESRRCWLCWLRENVRESRTRERARGGGCRADVGKMCKRGVRGVRRPLPLPLPRTVRLKAETSHQVIRPWPALFGNQQAPSVPSLISPHTHRTAYNHTHTFLATHSVFISRCYTLTNTHTKHAPICSINIIIISSNSEHIKNTLPIKTLKHETLHLRPLPDGESCFPQAPQPLASISCPSQQQCDFLLSLFCAHWS